MLTFFKKTKQKQKQQQQNPTMFSLDFLFSCRKFQDACSPHGLTDWRLQSAPRPWALNCRAHPSPAIFLFSLECFHLSLFETPCLICQAVLKSKHRNQVLSLLGGGSGHRRLCHRSDFHTSILSRGSFYQGSSLLSGLCIPLHQAAPVSPQALALAFRACSHLTALF